MRTTLRETPAESRNALTSNGSGTAGRDERLTAIPPIIARTVFRVLHCTAPEPPDPYSPSMDLSPLVLHDVVVSKVPEGHLLFVKTDVPGDSLSLLFRGTEWSVQYAVARGAR